jgi:hypothetical protein
MPPPSRASRAIQGYFDMEKWVFNAMIIVYDNGT